MNTIKQKIKCIKLDLHLMNKMTKQITSKDNEIIKYAIKLKETKTQKKENKVFLEGKNIIQEAVAYGIVEKILCLAKEENLFSSFKGELYVISEDVAKKMSDVETPQNVFAIAKLPKNEFDSNKNILVLDGVQDPGNLGTLIRSAKAFGFENIALLP